MILFNPTGSNPGSRRQEKHRPWSQDSQQITKKTHRLLLSSDRGRLSSIGTRLWRGELWYHKIFGKRLKKFFGLGAFFLDFKDFKKAFCGFNRGRKGFHFPANQFKPVQTGSNQLKPVKMIGWTFLELQLQRSGRTAVVIDLVNFFK